MDSNIGKKLADFWVMFLTQVVMYALLCFNYRAVAQANYFMAGISDFVFASTSFFVIKKIAKEEGNSIFLWFGYSSGGVVGSILGIWLSKIFLNG